MEENKNQPNNSTENTKKELNEEFIAELFEKFENKGIIIKEAVVQGGVRKEYIKEKDFSIFVEKEKEYVINELNQAVRPKLSLETKNISHNIIKTLVEAGFLLHAVPHDYDRKPKYPKKLNIVKGNCCEESECSEEEGEKQSTTPTKPRNFYVLNFKRPEKKSYFWLTTIIVIVLGFCMMPIWPIEVKLAIWWVSWIILIGIIGIFSVRLIFYIVFYSVGYDFWIFPNLTDDKLGVIDSFKPLYEIKKREDKLISILIRVAVAIGICTGTVYLYQNPELIDDFAVHLQEIYVDVLSWGNEKIIHYHNGTGISLVDKNDKYRRLIEEEDM